MQTSRFASKCGSNHEAILSLLTSSPANLSLALFSQTSALALPAILYEEALSPELSLLFVLHKWEDY